MKEFNSRVLSVHIHVADMQPDVFLAIWLKNTHIYTHAIYTHNTRCQLTVVYSHTCGSHAPRLIQRPQLSQYVCLFVAYLPLHNIRAIVSKFQSLDFKQINLHSNRSTVSLASLPLCHYIKATVVFKQINQQFTIKNRKKQHPTVPAWRIGGWLHQIGTWTAG